MLLLLGSDLQKVQKEKETTELKKNKKERGCLEKKEIRN